MRTQVLNNQGVTFLGLLQAILIFSIVSAACFGLMRAGHNLVDVANAKMNDNAIAMMQMVRDIRGGMNPQILSGGTRLLVTVKGKMYEYSVVSNGQGTQFLKKTITNDDGTTASEYIASHVQSANFAFDNTGKYQRIDITITYAVPVIGEGSRSKGSNFLTESTRYTVAMRNSRVAS